MQIGRPLLTLTVAILTCAAAQAGDITSGELRKALQENPGILIEAIKANKTVIYELILFQNQDKLGIDFYRKTAGDLGIDLERCEKDAGSQAVKDRIAADMAEAGRFGFNGTPGFLLDGVPANGAYPVEYFEEIIKRLDTTRTAIAP